MPCAVLHAVCCALSQVVMVSASLRANSLQQASAWLDTNPISIFSSSAAAAAGAGAKPLDPAAAADEEGAAEAGAAEAADGQQQSHWALMLPPTITHQVRQQHSMLWTSAYCTPTLVTTVAHMDMVTMR